MDAFFFANGDYLPRPGLNPTLWDTLLRRGFPPPTSSAGLLIAVADGQIDHPDTVLPRTARWALVDGTLVVLVPSGCAASIGRRAAPPLHLGVDVFSRLHTAHCAIEPRHLQAEEALA